jgi:hypothetical protein
MQYRARERREPRARAVVAVIRSFAWICACAPLGTACGPAAVRGSSGPEPLAAEGTSSAHQSDTDRCRGMDLEYPRAREHCIADPQTLLRPDDPVDAQQVIRILGPDPGGAPVNRAVYVRLEGAEAAVSAIRGRERNANPHLRIESEGPRVVRSGEDIVLELRIRNTSDQPQELVLTGCACSGSGCADDQRLCTGDTLTQVTLLPGGVLRWGSVTWTAAASPTSTRPNLGRGAVPEPLPLGSYDVPLAIDLSDSCVSGQINVAVVENPEHVGARLLELALHDHFPDSSSRLEHAVCILRSAPVHTSDEMVRRVELDCRRAFLAGNLVGESIENEHELASGLSGLDECALNVLPLIDSRGLRDALARQIDERVGRREGPAFGIEGCHPVADTIVLPRPRGARPLGAPTSMAGEDDDELDWERRYAAVVVRVDRRGRASRAGAAYGREALVEACWRAADVRYTPARRWDTRRRREGAAVDACFVAKCEFASTRSSER